MLRNRIRPFLLRRLKGDVLRELPEKVEITLTADMTEEQRRVYQASLLRLRPQVEGMLGGNNRIEMLAAITELRQICGHPSLVLPSYAASSGKLDLLLDVLPGSLEAGHRALIFSQFTRMLKILRADWNGGHLLHVSGRRNAAETPRGDGAAIQRGRRSGIPDFAQGGRFRTESRRRRHGHPLRPVVEPGSGRSGDRPRASASARSTRLRSSA